MTTPLVAMAVHSDELQLTNRLKDSRSPYVGISFRSLHDCHSHLDQVRSHMNNPVAWQMWDPEALDLARKHNRLLFLSIGYAACHCTQALLDRRTRSALILTENKGAMSWNERASSLQTLLTS